MRGLTPARLLRRSPRRLFTSPGPSLRAPISTSTALQAGHNKWSKIRHDKGAADRKRGVQNVILAKAITDASRKGGPDRNGNPFLATAIATAKAANVTSDFINRAVARGQSHALSGSALEQLTLEAVMPGNVALILDVHTDSRLRSLQDLNAAVKKAGGKPGSTLFYFEHCGRIIVDHLDAVGGEDGVEAEGAGGEGEDGVVDAVIGEEGVLDFDVEGDEVTIWTEAGATSRVAGVIRERCDIEARSVDLTWRAREDTEVALDSEGPARELASLLVALQGFPEVTGTYTNAVRGAVSEEAWAKVQENLISP